MTREVARAIWYGAVLAATLAWPHHEGPESGPNPPVFPTPAVAAPVARPQPPFGAPSLARQYANAKRLPLDRRVDTRALYRQAEGHLSGMPVFSSALNRYLGAPEARAARSGKGPFKGKWRPLGPGNIGGRTRTLVIDPGKPDTMIAGGVSGGVWRTTNGGQSWKPLGTGLANIAVNALAMHPKDSSRLYVGTGEGYFREDVRGTGLPLRGGGVFRSTNGGKRWKMLAATEGEDFWFVNDLVFSANGKRLYAATRSGVHRSDDEGKTWQQILEPDVKGGCLDLAIRADRSDDVLFASCGTFEQATIWRSEDAAARARGGKGPKFEAVLEDPGMGRTSIAIAPSDQNVIYALAASNDKGDYEQGLHAVFRSTTGGASGSWEVRIRNTATDFNSTLLLHNPIVASRTTCGFSAADLFLPMGWYVNALAVDPVDPEVVWAAGVDWFRSDDGGRSWGAASFWWGAPAPAFAHADQHTMAFHPDYDGLANRTVFISNDGGIYRSDDAGATVATGAQGLCHPANTAMVWTSLNNSFQITQFYFGLPFPDGAGLLGGAQDNGTLLGFQGSADGWLRVFGGDGGYVAIDPRDRRVFYVESQNGNLVKTTNGGVSFRPARSGLPPSDGRFLDPGGNFVFIAPFVMDPSNPDTLWIGSEMIYRSTDGASSWQQASEKLKGRVSAISVAPADSGRVVAGIETGFLYVHDDAMVAGPSTRWRARRPRKAWVTSVAHDPADPDVIYATYGGFGGKHVYRSLDGGLSWTSIDGKGATGLPDIPIHALLVDPVDSDRLYLGTDLGVFVSLDRGASWAQENAGFGNIVTESLSVLRQGSTRWVYAFTHGRGAWRVRLR